MTDKPQTKEFKCNKCGKEFDELLPLPISYLAPDSDHIPVTMEVCPYCFSDDVNVKFIPNYFLLAAACGIDVRKIVSDTIDEMVARGELSFEEE